MPVCRCGHDWFIHNLVVGKNLATRQLMTKFVGDSFQILITPSIPFNSIQHILIESFTVYNALGNLLSIRYNGNTLKISGLEFSSFLAFSPTIYMI